MSELQFTPPPPGLGGDYEGSCVRCLRGTDTALAFVGPPEWAIAGLCVLGLPEDQAEATYRRFAERECGCLPGTLPPPEWAIAFPVRVCQSCLDASGTGLEAGLIATGIPGYAPPGG